MLDQPSPELALLGGPTLPWSFAARVLWQSLLAGGPTAGDALVERAYLIVMPSLAGAGSEHGHAAFRATCLGLVKAVGQA
jgi:hypothetical protein